MTKFEIKAVQELFKIEEEQQAVNHFQDENSKAHVSLLRNGQYILIPAKGSKGLLVENKVALDSILSTGIPITEAHPNAFQRNQNILKAFPGNSDSLMKQLSDELNIKIDLSDNSDNYFASIDKAIKDYGYEKFYNNLFIPFGLFIAQKLLNHYQLDLKLQKKYGINPYYEPQMQTMDGSFFSPYYKLADYLLEKRKFSMKRFYESIDWFIRAYKVQPINGLK